MCNFCRTFGPSPKGPLRSYFLSRKGTIISHLAVHTQALTTFLRNGLTSLYFRIHTIYP